MAAGPFSAPTGVLALHLVQTARQARMRTILWLSVEFGLGLASLVTTTAVAASRPPLVGDGPAVAPIVLTSSGAPAPQGPATGGMV